MPAGEKRVQIVLAIWQRNRLAILRPSLPEMISRDAKQVGPESPALGVKSFCVAYQGHESFLCHVFSHRRISTHVQCVSINCRMLRPIEEDERLLVAGQNPANQAVFWELYGYRHVSSIGRLVTVRVTSVFPWGG